MEEEQEAMVQLLLNMKLMDTAHQAAEVAEEDYLQ
jgi:hypothetical protein